MNLAIYAPDRHIVYDGSTPDTIGVGGGITFRVRIAAALARAGHAVEVICNCSQAAMHDGVRYRPLDSVRSIAADAIFFHSSSGSGGGFESVPKLEIESRLKILVLSGPQEPKHWAACLPDGTIVPSNYVRQEVLRTWPTTLPRPVFVSHHGVSCNVAPFATPNLRRLVYASHPCKGLGPATEVLRILRRSDPAFHLHVYGGNRLWGGADEPVSEPGVTYFGLRPAPEVCRAYRECGFALHLQTIPDAFGLALADSMASGPVVIASPVGAYPELIDCGRNGFLIDGDSADAATHRRAADLIRELVANPARMEQIRRNGAADPLTWNQAASAWLSICDILLGYPSTQQSGEVCPLCRSGVWQLADGEHCGSCGYYFKRRP